MSEGDTAVIERPGSPPRRLRACVPCTKAKARCNFSEEGAARHICDRCGRMGILCEAKATKGLRKPRQIKPLVSRVESLEQKIDGLTTRLAEAGPSSAQEGIDASQGPYYHRPLSILTPDALRRTPESSSHHSSLGLDDDYDTDAAYDLDLPVEATVAPPFNFTWAQASIVLNEFKLKYQPKFPFVAFDNPEVTAFELLQQKPFLLRAILLVAAPVPVLLQARMRKEVMAYLGQHMLVQEEQTLDLLQGLLVCLAWVDLDLFQDHQMTNLSYLAMGYCHSLGLSRIPLALMQQLSKTTNSPNEAREAKIAAMLTQTHSLEEQRAYLGCFYIMAVNSIQFGRKNPFKSRYIDMCCETLSWSIGVPTDFMLVKTIRLTQLSERIAEATGSPYDRERGRSFAFLLEGHAGRIRTELDRIAESVNHQHPLFPLFWMHYNTTLVRLYSPAADPSPAAAPEGAPLYRIQCLFNALHAAAAFFKTLLSLAPDVHRHRPAATDAAPFVAAVAARLLLLDRDGWDRAGARAILDLGPTLDRALAVLRAAGEAARMRAREFVGEAAAAVERGDEGGGGALAGCVRRLEWVRGWYRARLAGEAAAMAVEPEGAGFGGEAGVVDLAGVEMGQASDAQWPLGVLGNTAWNFDTM